MKNQGRQTHNKQIGYAGILANHLKVVDPNSKYGLADLYGGKGTYVQPTAAVTNTTASGGITEGSPLVAYKILNKARPGNYEAVVYEYDWWNFKQLSDRMKEKYPGHDFQLIRGNNSAGVAFIQKVSTSKQGLIYFDPPGLQDPALVQAYMKAFPGFDILFRVQGKSSLRRMGHGDDSHVAPFVESPIGKTYSWCISEPKDYLMWHWLFGSSDATHTDKLQGLVNEWSEEKTFANIMEDDGFEWYARTTSLREDRKAIGLAF